MTEAKVDSVVLRQHTSDYVDILSECMDKGRGWPRWFTLTRLVEAAAELVKQGKLDLEK